MEPLRFVHAADFRLEQLPGGAADPPEALTELFLEAPYAAAEGVFETVLGEQADFLLLTGDLLDAIATGPRGPLFLVEQFHRLAEHDVTVYWVAPEATGERPDEGGLPKPNGWPTELELPPNVLVLNASTPEQSFRFVRGGLALAEIHRPQDVADLASFGFDRGTATDCLHIVPVDKRPMGKVDPAESLAEWAGGPNSIYWVDAVSSLRPINSSSPSASGAASDVDSRPAWLHHPGSPQGRTPQEPGPHGCSLIEVDGEGNVSTSRRPTDVMRWVSERILVDAQTTVDDLQSLIEQQATHLNQVSPDVDLLVTWTIVGDGPLPGQLRRGDVGEQLLERLRREKGRLPSSGVWTVGLRAEATSPDALIRGGEESILRDYLQAIDAMAGKSGRGRQQLDVTLDWPQSLRQCLTDADRARGLMLGELHREADLLGADLLAPDPPARTGSGTHSRGTASLNVEEPSQ